MLHRICSIYSQLYLRCQRQHMTTACWRLEMCITDVRHWMAANRLKLNADKTELLWVGSKYGSTLLGSSGPPRLGDETIMASDHVRLLGVTISSDLSPVKHVGTIAHRAFTSCVRSKEYDDHLTLSLRRLSYMPSSHHVLTVAILCWPQWPGRQEPSLTGYNIC